MDQIDKAAIEALASCKYSPAEVFSSSDHLDWTAIHAERRIHPAGEFPGVMPAVTEICFALKGNSAGCVHHFLGGEHYRVTPATGTLWLFPKGVAEDSAEITERVPDVVHIYLPNSLFVALGQEDGYPDVRPENLEYKVGFTDPLVEQLAKAIATEMQAPRAGGKAFVESAALTLTHQLLRSHSTSQFRLSEIPSSVDGVNDLRLRRVLEFVEVHLEHEIGVTDLAEVACLSPFYFSRAFKKATGYSPYQFLLHRRIEHAKSLLLRRELSVADVARRCQFSSASGFATAFASAVGVSPRFYRKKQRA